MFEFGQFIEIQVVGLLLLLALSPILLMPQGVRKGDGEQHEKPKLSDGPRSLGRRQASQQRWFGWSEDSHVRAGALVVIAFALGVMGNRLVDDLFGDLHVEGREAIAISDSDTLFRATDSSSWKLGNHRYLVDKVPRTKVKLKRDEYSEKENTPMIAYSERHRSFMRVLRGSAVAACLFLVLATIRIGIDTRGRTNSAPYTARDILAAGALMLLFTWAYFSESQHYYVRLCEQVFNTSCGPGTAEHAPYLGIWNWSMFAVESLVLVTAVVLARKMDAMRRSEHGRGRLARHSAQCEERAEA